MWRRFALAIGLAGLTIGLLGTMSCVRSHYRAARGTPKPGREVLVHARVPRVIDVDSGGGVIGQLTVMRAMGRLEWMRGDTVSIGLDSAVLSDWTRLAAPRGARTTVILDGSTQLLVGGADVEMSLATTVAVVSFLAAVLTIIGVLPWRLPVD